ncbi:MAG: sigma-70 family RNA polymerase sigma factor [Verrucomicrobia bacterium]|nr:sigma-70 family RNA polymerase sigma factor [Verrucomicrobiota bacterium]
MNSLTDQQLLRDYTERRSEAAFAELVRRHVDFVYSAALRMVRDAHLAEDVTQSAFVALAQNARQLTDRPVLSGWLHRVAQNLAANAVRSDVRRRAREQEAAAMNELLAAEPDASWEQIAPHLDAGLGELSEPDRDAVLLRYFEHKSAREMAVALGVSEEAAQKRVGRAVERLREFFAKRGVTVGASGLVVVISVNAVQAAPAGLAVTISTAAVLAGSSIATTVTVVATKAIAMTTLQKTLIAVTLVATVGTAIYEARQAQTLLRQQAQSTEQMAQLTRERDDATRQLTALRDENTRLNRNTAELLRLRGEVTQLRAGARELAQLKDNARAQRDVTEVALRSWLDRVKAFKRLPERMPDKTIPELRLLSEEDWLELAKKPLGHAAEEVNLEDDATARLVFRAVRDKAKDKLMRVLSRALEGYANAHDGQLPADTSQLKPYLMNQHFQGPARVVEISESAVDAAVLQRYEILQTGRLEDVPDDKAIIVERAPVDREHDTRLEVGKHWMGVMGLEHYSPEKAAGM